MDTNLINSTSCRVCLNQTKKTDKSFTDTDIEQYLFCTGISINTEDIPQKICQKCRNELKRFEQFKKKSIEVETRIKLLQLEIRQKHSDIDSVVIKADNSVKAEKFEEDELNINDYENSSFLYNFDEPKIEVTKSGDTDENFHEPNSDNKAGTVKKTSSSKKTRPKANKNEENANKKKKNTNKLPYSNPCHMCHLTFKSRADRKRHETEDHPKEPRFYCDLCNSEKSFNEKIKLLGHFQNLHCDTQPCPVCKKPIKTRRMQIHLKRMHSEEKNYFCHKCGRGFALRLQLERHYQRKHVERKDWKCVCNYCGKRVSLNLRALLY